MEKQAQCQRRMCVCSAFAQASRTHSGAIHEPRTDAKCNFAVKRAFSTDVKPRLTYTMSGERRRRRRHSKREKAEKVRCVAEEAATAAHDEQKANLERCLYDEFAAATPTQSAAKAATVNSSKVRCRSEHFCTSFREASTTAAAAADAQCTQALAAAFTSASQPPTHRRTNPVYYALGFSVVGGGPLAPPILLVLCTRLQKQ